MLYFESRPSRKPKRSSESQLKKGKMIQRSKDGVSVTKWKDKHDVLMISNKHSVEMVDITNRRGDSKPKPNVIRDYNDGMSGIDKADQMISYYDCLSKTTRWYKKFALHIIDIYVFNSYALHKKLSGKQKANLLEFRESIVKCLIKDKLNFDVPTTSQQTGFHYLEQLPSTEKKKWPTKPCRVCSKEKRRETRYFCPVCDVRSALCVNDCFKKYHS